MIGPAPELVGIRVRLRAWTRFVLRRIAETEDVSEEEIVERAVLRYLEGSKINSWEVHRWASEFRLRRRK